MPCPFRASWASSAWAKLPAPMMPRSHPDKRLWRRWRSALEASGANHGGIFQTIIDGIGGGRYRLNLDRTFPLPGIADAHRYMEANRAAGKVVGGTTRTVG
jgi:hypothetical protein